MAVTSGEGPGRAPKTGPSTITLTTPSEDKPSFDPLRSTSTRTRTSKGATFSRPVEPERPTLDRAVRESSGGSEDDKPEVVRTTGELLAGVTSASRTVARSSRERRGRETENDGRSDRLNAGGHVGGRDETIAALKASKDKLQGDRAKLKDEIADIETEIRSDEGKVDAAGTMTDVVTAPVGLIAGAFGKENPVTAKVEDLASNLLDLEEDKAELEDQEQELADQEAEIDAQIKELEDERALNFLADVAHVTDMPAPVADVLEGAEGLSIEVAEETGVDSDAAYDRVEKAIVIDDGVLEQVNESLTELQDEEIVDEDGNIVDEQAFDKSEQGDKAIGATVLVGVHEVTHGAQDERGKIEKVTKASLEIAGDTAGGAQALLGTNVDESLGGAITDARQLAEAYRSNRLEYASYVNQETVELQAGKKKKLFTTINPDGSLLPREQALENILALQAGKAMVHGVSAGQSVSDVLGEDAGHDHDHDHDDEHGRTGGRYTGGDGTPGRYTGGGDIPGRYTGGDGTPGRYTGGDQTPGRYTGGDQTPGRYTGGEFIPGRYTGGDQTPGRYTGGEFIPGRYTGGDQTPGRYTGGETTPGRYTGGDLTPGRYTGGDLTPGRYTGGDQTPGRYTGGFETG